MSASNNSKSLFKRIYSACSLRALKQRIDPLHSTSTCSSSSSSVNANLWDNSDSLISGPDAELLFTEKYEFGSMIGRGGSAEVYKVRNKLTGEYFACKIMRKDHKMNDFITMNTELTVLSKANHENILKMYEAYDTPTRLCLILELVEGDLIDAMHSLPMHCEATIAELFHQMLLGVNHLHELNIVHRDLKVDNLLFVRKNDKIIIKIADFGLSAIVNDSLTCHQRKTYKRLTQVWGTAEYFAPEVYRRQYGFQADAWALGCVLYEMLTGELCFPVREFEVKLIDRLLLGASLRRFECTLAFTSLSVNAQQLIRKLLKRNSQRRWSVEAALSSKWISGNASTETSPLLSAKQVISARAERRARRLQCTIQEQKRTQAYDLAERSVSH